MADEVREAGGDQGALTLNAAIECYWLGVLPQLCVQVPVVACRQSKHDWWTCAAEARTREAFKVAKPGAWQHSCAVATNIAGLTRQSTAKHLHYALKSNGTLREDVVAYYARPAPSSSCSRLNRRPKLGDSTVVTAPAATT